MKNFICVVFLILIMIFLIPMFVTTKFKTEDTLNFNVTIDNIIEEEIIPYNYNQFSNIKLFNTETGEIKEIPFDEYLYGVVASEMPAEFEIEALKAQAVVARTYTFYKMINNEKKHEGADICDNFACCQAYITKEDRMAKWALEVQEEYWNKIVKAVNDTKGKIIVYENKPINAFFHANSGGKTEIPINVWGGKDKYPYLQVIETAGEDAYTQYLSSIELNFDEITLKLKEKYNDIEVNFKEENDLQILEYTESGRVKTVKFGNKNLSGVEVRTLFSLKSTNFIIEKRENSIYFEVIGYGHGVGMSQTGADSLAKTGKNYEEIIKHYYSNIEIINY